MMDTMKMKSQDQLEKTAGRPRNVWLNIVQNAGAIPLSAVWRFEIARGRGAAQQSTRTTQRPYDDHVDDDDGVSVFNSVM